MQPQHPLPKMNYTSMTIDDIMDITLRLSTILAEESKLLTQMRVKELAPLQAEKHKLSQQLAGFQKQLTVDDRSVKAASGSAREELLLLTEDLAVHIEENMRRTVIAQTVNKKVMHTLTEVLAGHQSASVYGRNGQTTNGADITVSLNLNERA